MTRREFPASVKVAAFERCKGRCEGECGGTRLYPGKFRYNHRIPDAQGGEPTLENCECLCLACDRKVTYEVDIPTIAKTKRIRARHLGAREPGRGKRPLPCGRASGKVKKVSGEVVERKSQGRKHRETMEGRRLFAEGSGRG